MSVLLWLGGLIGAVAVATFAGRLYWNRRIARWAESEGLQLLESRGARFYEGPGAPRRTDSRFAFRITVRDGSGRVRHGWLTFGGYFSFWPAGPGDVRWDD